MEGKKFVGAPFTTISKGGLLLEELIPVGYEDNEELIDDICGNNDGNLYGDEFSFYVANPNGSIAAEYGWNRSYDESESKWNDDGAWVKGTGKSEIVTIAPGEALYTNCNWFQDGCAMSFPGLDDSRAE